MTGYEINGGKRLRGSALIQGAKNSALPILAATLLVQDKSELHNCPCLTDVEAAIKILVTLGCVCVRDNDTVIVDALPAANYEIPENLMREMRSSVVFLGAIISRMGKAVITTPGGCELGPRPIDLHISSLKQLGVNIECEENCIICTAPNGIKGATINLPFPSVGATENIIIAAALSKGTTIINGAAKEPEISDLADFLNASGAKIYGAGSSTVVIHGVRKLHSPVHKVISDRIVAATYLSAAAITNGEILLKGVTPSHLTTVLKFFENIGCTVSGGVDSIYLKVNKPLSANGGIITGVYPEFPTDAGPLMVPLLCKIKGESFIKETIFENRFRFSGELQKFGAKLVKENEQIKTLGESSFNSAEVFCTDLRAGAALVIAALAAEGKSFVKDIYHIERGYCCLHEELKNLGADIIKTMDI